MIKANVNDLVRLPFLLANKLTAPVAEIVEQKLGDEIRQIVGYIPGLNMIEDLSNGFNCWVQGNKSHFDDENSELPEKNQKF